MAREEDVKRLADRYSVTGDIIRALIGLSKPFRKQVKMLLTMYKQQLQGLVLKVGYKLSLSLRHRAEAVKIQQKDL